MNLRDYQHAAHAAVRRVWSDPEAPGALLVMATGTGKTITGLALAVSDFLAHGQRVVWLAHREELLNQPRKNMAALWPEYSAGIVQADRHTPDAQIVFASVDTLAASPHRANEITEAGPIALVVVDEAHHATSPTHQTAMEAIGAPLRLGLTATPHRDDGADLSDEWEIAYSYGIAEAIAGGYLVRPYAVVDRVPDLNLEVVSGRWDYADAALGVELLRAGVVEHTVSTMRKTHEAHPLPREDGGEAREMTARGRSWLVFTATVEQARLTAEALRADGWEARHISGETPKAQRRRLLRAFEKGTIDVLCNASVLTEGTDLPIASGVLLGRPTRSWSLYVQMLGRGLRLHEGKSDCLVIDLAGATEDHSLIFAPVLIGGSRCRKSPNGEHAYDRTDGGAAQCSFCGSKLACWERMGPHKWEDIGNGPHCSGCGRAQCVESPTAGHAWQAVAGHKRRCLYCGAEVYDELAGMVGDRKKRAPDAVEGDWVRIRGVHPHCAAVDVGEFGILFVTWEDEDGFRPQWLRKRCRTVQPLTDKPVPREYVRAYADDLIGRAAKIAGVDARWKSKPRPSPGQIRYGERYGVVWQGEEAGVYARRVFVVRARERALKVGLVEEVDDGK